MSVSLSQFWQPHIDVRRFGRVTMARRYAGAESEILRYCHRIARLTRRGLERRYQWDLHRLDFIFLDRRSVNAVALRGGRRHAVGVCVGLPFAAKRYIDRAMANPEFLEKYLKPAERPEWSWRFLGMLVEHVYLHEAAHALRGHFDYLRRPVASARFDEQSGSPGHYVELDADIHALDMFFAISELEPDHPTKPSLLLDWYFQRLFTLFLLYQLLDSEKRTIRAYRRLDHPHPVHRALLLASALLQTFPGLYRVPRRRVENAHHQAIWEASVAARTAHLVQDRWWGGKRGRQRGMREYRRLFNHYRKVVEPRLDAFGASLPDDLV